MADNLIITRLWQDIEFFQIEIECKTELIAVRGKVYTTDDLIDDLCNKIEAFLSGHMDATCWQNGTRGDTTTPCTALRFSRKDELGHVLIEVFMEIDDTEYSFLHFALPPFRYNFLRFTVSAVKTPPLMNSSANHNTRLLLSPV